jgi:dCTP deaminase
VAYQVKASFLPGEAYTVEEQLRELTAATVDLTRPQVLQKGCVYVAPLQEHLALPSGVSGRANPKSSTGRIDVFTRLITDHGSDFDRVAEGYKGALYIEIAPHSFSIQLQQGARLNQLRLMRGRTATSDASLRRLEVQERLVYAGGDPVRAIIADGLWFSVDLKGDDTASTDIIGYKAIPRAPVIDLNVTAPLDPREYWEPVARPKRDYLILEPGEFYILGSRERVRVPNDYAAEMVGYDPSVGEFRVHYAGFFDPGFGYGDNDILGAKAVLEVRSHEVPFLLRHGQRVGRLLYERLTEEAAKIYGAAGAGSSYQRQGLRLSRYFAPWPG